MRKHLAKLSNNEHPRNRQAGFTLLELIITLAIVGIASTIAITSLTALTKDTDSETYSRDLSKTISYARIQSVSIGQTVTLCPIKSGICTTDWSKELTLFVDANNNRTLGDNQILRIIEAIPEKDSLSYSGTSAGISFYSDGSIGEDDNGSFSYYVNKVCDTTAKGVNVNSSGRARYIESVTC